MHYRAEIVIPPKSEIEKSIGQVMDYFRDEDDEGQKTAHAWNHVEHQQTVWKGNVKSALDEMMVLAAKDEYPMTNCPLAAEWLVVTVDYHN